jgi:hypothetical protein
MEVTEATVVAAEPATPSIEIFDDSLVSPSTKLLLLGGGGITWFTGFFLMPAALVAGGGLAVIGAVVVGSAGYSLHKSGHSLPSAMRRLTGDLAEIVEDCSGGAARAARDHVLRPAKMAAIELAKKTGTLSESELSAVEKGGAPDLVRVLDHVFELIVGTSTSGTNCAILAKSLAGKTTFFHGLFYHLATRPGKKILMIGDYNLGKDNGGGVPQWLGLPIYDRRRHGSQISNFVFAPDEIMGAIQALGAVYEDRIRLAADAVKDRRSAPKFDPIYFACDEFQSFMEHCNEADNKMVGEIAGKLLRARGWKIFFFPVLHNDKADGFLNTTVMGGFNLLVLGSFVSKLDSAPELQNSRNARRFDPEASGRVTPIRRELERDLGKEGAIRSLAALSLTHPITTSDGTEFGDGTHLLQIPDCRKVLDSEWDWPEDLKAAPSVTQDPDRYFAARAVPQEVETLMVRVAIEDENFDDLAPKLQSIFLANYTEFESQSKGGKITKTKFFGICVGHGFGKNRNTRDRHYRMIGSLAIAFPDGVIDITDLRRAMSL